MRDRTRTVRVYKDVTDTAIDVAKQCGMPEQPPGTTYIDTFTFALGYLSGVAQAAKVAADAIEAAR
jgi:hypothetical protein